MIKLRSALVKRRPEDHKGTFGHVLLVAGSRGMAGAAILATKAALRSGAGLVTAAVPRSLQDMISAAAPEALTLGLPETRDGTIALQAVDVLLAASQKRGFTTLGLGPGLSTQRETREFVLNALRRLPLPAVVDADGLNALAIQKPGVVAKMLLGRGLGLILTPHPGELARCLGKKTDRQAGALRLAREWGAVALLKGHKTLITDGKRTIINPTGGPGLAKGGTGDVLTGLIAGLWAQMLASGRVQQDVAFLAAALGAHIHGKAGDAAEKELTPWAMTAADVVSYLPQAFKSLMASRL